MITRKLILLFVGICLAGLLGSCELDNYEMPDAQVFGVIKDAETGEPIEQEYGYSGDAVSLEVIEYGYAIRSPQGWKVMRSGEYRNNLVFSGTYDIILHKGNFIPLDTIKSYQIVKGENKLDFSVTPNIRIHDVNIEKAANAITGTFKLEYAHAAGKISEIALFCQGDMNPSNSFNLSNRKVDVSDRGLDFVSKATYANEQFTVSIDLSSDEGKRLQSGRSYFFRVGAKPTGLGGGIPERYNYSKVVEVKM
jgi:hypothetical protein